MDTRGNNGLVVGAKGSNVKRIEEETGAKVDCMKDKTTVAISGRRSAVEDARARIEVIMRDRRIEGLRGRWDVPGELRWEDRGPGRGGGGGGGGGGNHPGGEARVPVGGDLRGQLKRVR